MVDMERRLIDMKKEGHERIDIYQSLSAKQPKKAKTVVLKKTQDQASGPGQFLLAAKDWYFSDLHRVLMVEHLRANELQLDEKTAEEFKQFDRNRGPVMRGPGNKFDQIVNGLEMTVGKDRLDLIQEGELKYCIDQLKTVEVSTELLL